MTKNQDPYAPPVSGAAKARMEHQRARRAAVRKPSEPASLLGGRAAWWVFGGAVVAFVLALSLAWGDGSHAGFATLVGAAAGVGWLALSLGFVWWRRAARLAGSSAGGRPAARR